DSTPPLSVERFGLHVVHAQRLIDRVAAAEHLQEWTQIAAETLAQKLTCDQAFRVRDERRAAVEFAKSFGKILDRDPAVGATEHLLHPGAVGRLHVARKPLVDPGWHARARR